MANQFSVTPLGGLAQLQMINQGMQGIGENFQRQRLEEQAMKMREQAVNAVNSAFQSGDPNAIREAMIRYPDMAESARNAFGFTNERSEAAARETYRRALSDPDNALSYLQEGIQSVQAAGGRPTNMMRDLQMLQQNPEAALKNMRAGYAALAGDSEFNAMFGDRQNPTAFMQEMSAAGIEPGSEAYKSAVLERYGKGSTIGYDVVEAYNPQTDRNEYWQVSRTEGGRRIPLGIAVPTDPRVEAAQMQRQTEQRQQAQKEMGTIDDMLTNVNQIIESPGLESWAGIEAMAPVIPGTEQANTDALVERLQSQQFLKNIGQMRGMGALSNAEGQKVAAAAAALKRAMTDKAVKAELNRIKTELEKARKRIESGQLLPPEQSSSGVPNVNAAEGRTQADRAANAAADAGVVNWSDL